MGISLSKHNPNCITEQLKETKKTIKEMQAVIKNKTEIEKKLILEINDLKNKLKDSDEQRDAERDKIKDENFEKNLDKFVENWFEKNKEIDIGVISTPFGNIDVLPDKIEKHLYKKISKVVFAVLSELDINFMGNNVSLDIKPKSAN